MRTPDQQLEYLHARQASAWVQVLPSADPEQRAAFVAWLKESPRNVRDFLLMLTIDHALEQIDAEHLQDIRSLVAQVDPQVVKFPGSVASAKTRTPRLRAWQRGAIAASMLVMLAAGWLLFTHSTSEWKQFETGTGEQRAFELEDGSVIHLNTRSRVALHFTQHARDVRLLQGEALFKVHHDTSRPFRVYTDDAMVQAVGTQFNVYDQADGTRVSVIEGRVKVTPELRKQQSARGTALSGAGAAVDAVSATTSVRSLGAKEEALVTHAGVISVRTLSEASEAIAWRERRLVFREQALQTIVEEFNRYSRQQIRLDGEGLANRTYTGVFDADDSESLAQALAIDTDLLIEKSGSDIVIRTR